MGKIITLKNDAYFAQINQIKIDLEKFRSLIYTHAINLACSGEWKEWNDSMEDGDLFSFTYEALIDTGDKNIDKLMEIYNFIGEMQSKIK
ncbi:MAG TPA: hypothetical protein DDX39_10755 [Bacteroidales bacterium]|nr:MAG: hypothetical protein A2W98_13145 [Bacteroidetes bacterium GWF2_33_38]OFY72395.1 MAG: hypothetical protein A2265_07430 [Bacteroidetes bacterium RIFOXYA12_FULL_33_9]OFY89808.1 MAG: hypothetical protein A2236_13280 [Bacteroidetes bacterium RIFOXYA2_FULL_33_7]HBF89111.1 hypothetical protein [Bacteroidales bacterium]